jgi:hypothetical protein
MTTETCVTCNKHFSVETGNETQIGLVIRNYALEFMRSYVFVCRACIETVAVDSMRGDLKAITKLIHSMVRPK